MNLPRRIRRGSDVTIVRHAEGGPSFRDRREAGRALARSLSSLAGEQPVVLALPRGGVPVAAEVARSLGAPLDVIVVRKLGVPFQPELGFGAIGEGGIRVLDHDLIRRVRLSEDDIADVEANERRELRRRIRLYRGGCPPTDIVGRTVVIVDDGLATGGTARAAVQVVRAMGARRIVLAVPVAPTDTVRDLESEADQVVCLMTPSPFFGVGQWYDDFRQTSDDEVADLLLRAASLAGSGTRQPNDPDLVSSGLSEDAEIPVDGIFLGGRLEVPAHPTGIVLFAHGSGSSRTSPRNQATALSLRSSGFGTLLFDLLTPREAADRRQVFDIDLLAHRLLDATRWIHLRGDVGGLPFGYFGASTGGGAALRAAAVPGNEVSAVVSRGGRPDLAGDALPLVRCPTLLVVGGADVGVLELNRDAGRRLHCPWQLAIVPGATHLFEEAGALESVDRLAAGWFDTYLAHAGHPPSGGGANGSPLPGSAHAANTSGRPSPAAGL